MHFSASRNKERSVLQEPCKKNKKQKNFSAVLEGSAALDMETGFITSENSSKASHGS